MLKEVHLSVKLVSYEKNRPEVLSAIFRSAENSISVFFCQNCVTDISFKHLLDVKKMGGRRESQVADDSLVQQGYY